MEIDFSKNANAPAVPADSVAPAPQQTAVAPIESGVPQAGGGLVLGDKLPTLKDVILPRLNLVQGSGKLARKFPFGSITFDQRLVLFSLPEIDPNTGNIKAAGTPPLVLTVLGFRETRFAEKTSGDVRGMIVDTEAEVRASGGTLDYNEWKLKKASGMKRFEPLVDALVAIERPAGIKDDDTVFVYPVNGKKYALALWGIKGTAYTAACKRVFFYQRSMGCLRSGYPTFSWNISTRIEPGDNPYCVPVVLPNSKSTPEFLEFVAGILNAPDQP